MDRKDIFMSVFKSKIGYSFTCKDLAEFEAIIDFYENKQKKQKEVIDKAIECINKHDDGCYTDITCKCKVAELNITKLLDILKEVSEWVKFVDIVASTIKAVFVK